MSGPKSPLYTQEFAAKVCDAWNACHALLEAADVDTAAGKVRVQGSLVTVQAPDGRVQSVEITEELIGYAYPAEEESS